MIVLPAHARGSRCCRAGSPSEAASGRSTSPIHGMLYGWRPPSGCRGGAPMPPTARLRDSHMPTPPPHCRAGVRSFGAITALVSIPMAAASMPSSNTMDPRNRMWGCARTQAGRACEHVHDSAAAMHRFAHPGTACMLPGGD